MDLAKFVFAILYNEHHKDKLSKALQELYSLFGEADYLSPEFHFQFLERYYGKEMGTPLKKFYISVKGLRDKEELVQVKLKTMEIEEKYSINGKRTVNIDPGYVDESQLILASHKRRGARVYLSKGIYAEIELLYVYGDFHPLYWTYRDYRYPEVRKIFRDIRKLYLKERKSLHIGKTRS